MSHHPYRWSSSSSSQQQLSPSSSSSSSPSSKPIPTFRRPPSSFLSGSASRVRLPSSPFSSSLSPTSSRLPSKSFAMRSSPIVPINFTYVSPTAKQQQQEQCASPSQSSTYHQHSSGSSNSSSSSSNNNNNNSVLATPPTSSVAVVVTTTPTPSSSGNYPTSADFMQQHRLAPSAMSPAHSDSPIRPSPDPHSKESSLTSALSVEQTTQPVPTSPPLLQQPSPSSSSIANNTSTMLACSASGAQQTDKSEAVDDAVASLLSIQQQCHPQDHRALPMRHHIKEEAMDEDMSARAEDRGNREMKGEEAEERKVDKEEEKEENGQIDVDMEEGDEEEDDQLMQGQEYHIGESPEEELDELDEENEHDQGQVEQQQQGYHGHESNTIEGGRADHSMATPDLAHQPYSMHHNNNINNNNGSVTSSFSSSFSSSSAAPSAMYSATNNNRDAQPSPASLRLAPIQPRPSSVHSQPENTASVSSSSSSPLVAKGYQIKDIPPTGGGAKKRTTPAKHQCPECGKMFTRPFNLKSHQRTHTQERPFVCPVKECQRAFSRLHDCNRHTRTHWRVKPYSCPECGRNFVRQDALTRHLRLDFGHNRCTGAPKDRDKDKEKDKDASSAPTVAAAPTAPGVAAGVGADAEKSKKPIIKRIAAKPENSLSTPNLNSTVPPDFTGKEPQPSFNKYGLAVATSAAQALPPYPHDHPATPPQQQQQHPLPADEHDPARRSILSTPTAKSNSPASLHDAAATGSHHSHQPRPLGLAITLPTDGRGGEPRTPPNHMPLTPREQMVARQDDLHPYQRRLSDNTFEHPLHHQHQHRPHHDPRIQTAHPHTRSVDSWHSVPSPATPVTPGAPLRASPSSPLDHQQQQYHAQAPHQQHQQHHYPGHLASRASSWSEPMPPRKPNNAPHVSYGSQEAGPWDRSSHPRSVSAPYPPPPPPHASQHHNGYPAYPYSPRETPLGHEGRSSQQGDWSSHNEFHYGAQPIQPNQQQQHPPRVPPTAPAGEQSRGGGNNKDWVQEEERVHPHTVSSEMMDRGHPVSYPTSHPGYRGPLPPPPPMTHRPYSYTEGASLSPSSSSSVPVHGQPSSSSSPHWRPYSERNRSEPDASHLAMHRPPVRSASMSSAAPQFGPPPPPTMMRRSPSPAHRNSGSKGSIGLLESPREGYPRRASSSFSHGSAPPPPEDAAAVRPRPTLPQRSWSSVTLPPLSDLDMGDQPPRRVQQQQEDVTARPYPPEYQQQHRSMPYGPYPPTRSATMDDVRLGSYHQQHRQESSSAATPFVSFRFEKSPTSPHQRPPSPTTGGHTNGTGWSSFPLPPPSSCRYSEHHERERVGYRHQQRLRQQEAAERGGRAPFSPVSTDHSHKPQPPPLQQHHAEAYQRTLEEEPTPMAVDERR